MYQAKKNLYKEQIKHYQANTAVLDAEIKKNIRSVYYQLWYLQDKQKLFHRLDSIYRSLNDAAILKVKTGDSPGLDSIAANVRMKELQAMMQQVSTDMEVQQQIMMQLLNNPDTVLPLTQPLERLPLSIIITDSIHPSLALQSQNINIADAEITVVKNENKPEFSGRFFSQRLYAVKDPYTGFSLTASFALFGMKAYKNKIATAKAEWRLQQKQYEYDTQSFNAQRARALQEVQKNNSLLLFYETAGLKQADEMIKASSLAYRAGEISFADLSQYLSQSIDIQKNYLEVLNTYNQSVIQYHYYINQ